MAGGGDIGIELVDKIRVSFPKLKQWCLAGPGEPTLNKDYGAIVRSLLEADCRINTVTNGTRLSKLDLPWDKFMNLNISVNEVEAEEHREITGKDSFSQLEEGIKSVVKKDARLLMTFVVGLGNVERLEDYLRYAGQWPRTTAVPILALTPQSEADKSSLLESEELQEAFAAVKAKTPESQSVAWPRFRAIPKRKGGCGMSRDVLVVNGKGEVAVCCRGAGPRSELGNVLDEGRAVWKNKALSAFRKRVWSNKKPIKCRACPEPEI